MYPRTIAHNVKVTGMNHTHNAPMVTVFMHFFLKGCKSFHGGAVISLSLESTANIGYVGFMYSEGVCERILGQTI